MDENKTLLEIEKEAIKNSLRRNMPMIETAKVLGVSRAALYRLMKKHGITRGNLND